MYGGLSINNSCGPSKYLFYISFLYFTFFLHFFQFLTFIYMVDIEKMSNKCQKHKKISKTYFDGPQLLFIDRPPYIILRG